MTSGWLAVVRSAENGLVQCVGKQLVHFLGRMVDAVGKQHRGIRAVLCQRFPLGIAVANRNAFFLCRLDRRRNICVHFAVLGLVGRGCSRVAVKFIGGIPRLIAIEHIGGHEDTVEAVFSAFFEDAFERREVFLKRNIDIVESEANDHEVGPVRQNIAVEDFVAVACAFAREGGVDHIDGEKVVFLIDHESQSIMVERVIIEIPVHGTVRHAVTHDDNIDGAVLLVGLACSFGKLCQQKFSHFLFYKVISKTIDLIGKVDELHVALVVIGGG